MTAGVLHLIAGLKQLWTLAYTRFAKIKAYRSRDDGAVAIEYGLIAALVVAVVIVALVQLRANLVDLPLPALNMAFEEALS